MILIEATIKYAGYDPNDLKTNSDKRICCACDDCGRVLWTRKRQHNGLCRSCACRTEEFRRKISVTSKGRVHSEESRERIRNALKGKPKTEDHNRKVAEANMGKFLSKEHRIALSAAKQGIQIDDWTHFISFEPYCEKFNNRFKEMIRESFNRVCFLCPTTEEDNDEKLSVHHVNYDKNCLCESECDFVPLCRVCHAATAHNRDYWEALITEMLSGFWTEYEVN